MWERVTRYKAPVVEPRDSALFPQVRGCACVTRLARRSTCTGWISRETARSSSGLSLSQAIEEYKSKLDDPSTSGAVFFAVCKGKVRSGDRGPNRAQAAPGATEQVSKCALRRSQVSEGLDFSDRAGRGVIITGIPYALATDPKVRNEDVCLRSEAQPPLVPAEP